MDPTPVCCPKLACPARGQAGQRHMRLPARQDRRFLGPACHQPCTAPTGTAFDRLRTSAEPVTLVVPRMAHGCPRPAIVVACGLDERPVARGWGRAGGQGQAVPPPLVELPRDLGEGPADAIRVQPPGGLVWMALARLVRTRLGRAGAVSAHRDLPRLRRRRTRGHAWARTRPLVCGPEGWCADVRAGRATFREASSRGQRGRPQRRAGPQVLSAQVVTRDETRRVVAVERRRVQGAAARVATIRDRSPGDGVIHTASSARLNATFRERRAARTRRGRAGARQTGTWPHGMDRMGPLENVCTPPERWRWAQTAAGEACVERTPAMAAGMTEQGWRVRARLSCHGPPPRWRPPKRRGRPSRALQCLVERWCS